MTRVFSSIKLELIAGDPQFVRFLEDWTFYSVVLGCLVTIPKGFICDLESVPFLKGTNNEAGAGHDFVSRSNFRLPDGSSISKWTAAMVYREIQEYFDCLEAQEYDDNLWGKICRESNRVWDMARRGIKTGVVVIAPGYWQKHTIEATYEEMSGCKEIVLQTA